MASPNPLLLTIDCCDQHATVGLVSGNRIVAVAQTPPQVRTAVSLVPTIHLLYQQASETLGNTKTIAVTYGPGSFTSLRIGLTVAKSIAYAGHLPLIGVNSLDVLLLAGRDACRRQNSSTATGPTGAPPQESHCWVGRAAKAAYRSQSYQKDVELIADGADSLDLLMVQQRLTEYNRFRTQGGSNQLSDESRLNDWACGQPEPSLTVLSEDVATAKLWRTIRGTRLGATKGGLERIVEKTGNSRQILVGDFPFESQVDSTGANTMVFRAPLPTPAEAVAAMARLAWETVLVISPESLDPMLVQPVYYRVSAAEDQLR
ncbi:MAG: tRNA (adenosine(37)-N6)-threonylcarbamoyltransferase complex dimerization subunit type 1 TsaB [Pirellulaceae bacterium]|nr:tRNA (adenosine(37)-N6)-threonylcarbamoyltransferase complex dimerization subunit type 1 TsaB [Pirellulaceae bacterium]